MAKKDNKKLHKDKTTAKKDNKIESAIKKPEEKEKPKQPRLYSGKLLVTIPVEYTNGKGTVYSPIIQPSGVIDVKTLREILKLADNEITTMIEKEILSRKI